MSVSVVSAIHKSSKESGFAETTCIVLVSVCRTRAVRASGRLERDSRLRPSPASRRESTASVPRRPEGGALRPSVESPPPIHDARTMLVITTGAVRSYGFTALATMSSCHRAEAGRCRRHFTRGPALARTTSHHRRRPANVAFLEETSAQPPTPLVIPEETEAQSRAHRPPDSRRSG